MKTMSPAWAERITTANTHKKSTIISQLHYSYDTTSSTGTGTARGKGSVTSSSRNRSISISKSSSVPGGRNPNGSWRAVACTWCQSESWATAWKAHQSPAGTRNKKKWSRKIYLLSEKTRPQAYQHLFLLNNWRRKPVKQRTTLHTYILYRWQRLTFRI